MLRSRFLALASAAAVSGAALAAAAPAASAATGGAVTGFASGDAVTVGALQTQQINLAKAAIAQSAAGVSSNGKLQTVDSMQNKVLGLPSDGKTAFAHGSGVNLNLAQGAGTYPQLEATTAEAVAPPRSSDSTALVPLPDQLAPLLKGSVQPNTATANPTSNDDVCVLGAPISRSTANVADLGVLNTDTIVKGFSLLTADQALRTVSTETLVPVKGQDGLGLASAAAIEPVSLTLFKGTPAALTLKVLNPIVLTAFAGGHAGSASASYGTSVDGNSAGDVPVLEVDVAGQQPQQLTLSQLVGDKGITLHLGIADVEIAAPATTKAASDGTSASAQGDLIKIQVPGTTPLAEQVTGPLGQVLNPVLGPVIDQLNKNAGDPIQQLLDQLRSALGAGAGALADIRVGHLEANAAVPAGGVTGCTDNLKVTKTSDKDPVTAGDTFNYTITVTNPYDCTLTDVGIDDTIKATDEGITWSVQDASPKAASVSNGEVKWSGLGPIQPGQSLSTHIKVHLDQATSSGKLVDHAVANGSCALGAGGEATDVNVTGETTVQVPSVK